MNLNWDLKDMEEPAWKKKGTLTERRESVGLWDGETLDVPEM